MSKEIKLQIDLNKKKISIDKKLEIPLKTRSLNYVVG
jgi:hypothetical protein